MQQLSKKEVELVAGGGSGVECAASIGVTAFTDGLAAIFAGAGTLSVCNSWFDGFLAGGGSGNGNYERRSQGRVTVRPTANAKLL